ncbi:MAG: transporter [Magnetococcales bacterium]|nr:transporter [Magnetococcales bacterium]
MNRFKTMALAGMCATGLALLSEAQAAGEQGHYVHGVEGIKAASLPPPGLYWRWYNAYYSATKLKDKNGDNQPVGLDLDVFATVNRLIWMTPNKFLGADYGMDIIVPLINTNLNLNNIPGGGLHYNEFGLGDITIEPLLLSWHGAQWDAAAAVGAYLPTGRYDKTDSASPGKDFYTLMFTLGGTWYPDAEKLWSMSILSRYETHSKKDETDLRLGDDFHFEWGVGRKVSDLVELGLAGYAQWQVTDDKGSAAVGDPTVHDRVFGIGPEVMATVPFLKSVLSLRAIKEFGAEDRPQGSIVALTLTKPL